MSSFFEILNFFWEFRTFLEIWTYLSIYNNFFYKFRIPKNVIQILDIFKSTFSIWTFFQIELFNKLKSSNELFLKFWYAAENRVIPRITVEYCGIPRIAWKYYAINDTVFRGIPSPRIPNLTRNTADSARHGVA